MGFVFNIISCLVLLYSIIVLCWITANYNHFECDNPNIKQHSNSMFNGNPLVNKGYVTCSSILIILDFFSLIAGARHMSENVSALGYWLILLSLVSLVMIIVLSYGYLNVSDKCETSSEDFDMDARKKRAKIFMCISICVLFAMAIPKFISIGSKAEVNAW